MLELLLSASTILFLRFQMPLHPRVSPLHTKHNVVGDRTAEKSLFKHRLRAKSFILELKGPSALFVHSSNLIESESPQIF